MDEYAELSRDELLALLAARNAQLTRLGAEPLATVGEATVAGGPPLETLGAWLRATDARLIDVMRTIT